MSMRGEDYGSGLELGSGGSSIDFETGCLDEGTRSSNNSEDDGSRSWAAAEEISCCPEAPTQIWTIPFNPWRAESLLVLSCPELSFLWQQLGLQGTLKEGRDGVQATRSLSPR